MRFGIRAGTQVKPTPGGGATIDLEFQELDLNVQEFEILRSFEKPRELRVEAKHVPLVNALRSLAVLVPELIYPKRSFLKLPVELDSAALTSDLEGLSESDWIPSPWQTRVAHESIKLAMLRGGDNQDDPDEVNTGAAYPNFNRPLMDKVPYIRRLLSEEGPFGEVYAAFLFRMPPGGTCRLHRDGMVIWESLYRIHIPLRTHPDALFISGNRAINFKCGECWTFDNQKRHGVINGAKERTHLIFDVPPNSKVNALVRAATFDAGEELSDERLKSIQPLTTTESQEE